MRIFNKHISAAFNLSQPGEGSLFGVEICPGECECCGNPVTVTRIGIGFGEIDVFVQEGH